MASTAGNVPKVLAACVRHDAKNGNLGARIQSALVPAYKQTRLAKRSWRTIGIPQERGSARSGSRALSDLPDKAWDHKAHRFHVSVTELDSGM